MQKALPLILIGFGVFFLVTAVVVGFVVFPSIVNKKISSQVRLQEGSLTWDKWRNITTPIYIKYYLFNVTNPDEIIKGGKPILKEEGPYVYEQKRTKEIDSINEELDTVTYRQTINYFYREDLSDGRSDQDVFNVLNVILAGFTSSPFVARESINDFVLKNKETLFIKRTVDELFFKGTFSQTVKDLSDKFFGGTPQIPNNTFGFYYGKNGTAGVPLEVHRGVEDSSEFGQIVKWNNQPQLNWWGGEFCNMINGTDGSIFAPFVTRDRVLRIFSEEICRSLYLTYKKDVEHHGIPGYRFALPQELLQRASVNEDNKCFCENIGPKEPEPAPPTNNETKVKVEVLTVPDFDDDDDMFKSDDEETKKEAPAPPQPDADAPVVEKEDEPKVCRAGVIMLSPCKKNKPIVASTPHFLYGERSDISNVEGLNPIEEKHETFIDLEINTGLVLQASKKIQISVNLKKTSGVHQMGKIQGDMTFPVFWADEYAAMPAERAEEFKSKLLSTFHIADISKWSIIGVSAALILIGLIVFVLRAKRSKYLP